MCAAVTTHKRRELAFRAQKLREHRDNVDKPVKHGCQSYYHGVGARIQAKEAQAAREAATQAATDAHQDPRTLLSTAELRELYTDTTGNAKW